MRRSEAEVRAAYTDLLESEDPGLVRVAQFLDAGYGMHAAPTAIREEPFAVSNYLGAVSEPKASRPSIRTAIRWAWSLPAVAIVALALLAVGVSLAVTSVTDLGKPVNIQSTASYFPLSGFHRVRLSLKQGKKPELLFLGAQGSNYDAINAERWPLVKALDQFGRLTRVSAVQPVCTTEHGGLSNGQVNCTIATFNLAHARYSSRYVAFVSRDLIAERVTGKSVAFHAFQRVTPVERHLFNRFARPRGRVMCEMVQGDATRCKTFAGVVEETIISNEVSSTGRGLPLIAIGDYVQTASQVLTPSDLTRTIALTSPPGRTIYAAVSRGLPFGTVQQALIHQKDPPTSRLVETVNAEANIITALICHADRMQPKKVCGRPVIREIGRHVR